MSPNKYGCTYEGCGKLFSNPQVVRRHIKIAHEKEARLKCTWEGCGFVGWNCDNLREHHEARHLKLRKYSCSFCGATFGYKGVVRKHEKQYHLSKAAAAATNTYQPRKHVPQQNPSSLACDLCDLTYFDEASLARHRVRVHKFPSSSTSSSSSSGDSVAANRMIVQCSMCNIHLQRGSLHNHMRNKHDGGESSATAPRRHSSRAVKQQTAEDPSGNSCRKKVRHHPQQNQGGDTDDDEDWEDYDEDDPVLSLLEIDFEEQETEDDEDDEEEEEEEDSGGSIARDRKVQQRAREPVAHARKAVKGDTKRSATTPSSTATAIPPWAIESAVAREVYQDATDALD